mmetsp:Transcript_35277/g.140193  ORF Transcript_35277/g.140193 Transcript_35277/m.140193 type:complete len:133 (-) Transcript_35277:1111-1509(-)|eukprot:CAMPEP_0113955354 /NCGR_PEP_ID=MMETSP0011_2-20120614/1271_1 /TAXON_ID=101924 /ORGANISM="Rhodosorus marinus" /LENGTH=132 /DNA_ID=CAMNT_0000965003 /DNA_START=38 /DNA_END=436 /DNA_ORIENTATION=- /assembly_acc=CAM_ASM_000156
MNPGTQDWTPTILGGNNRRPSKASMNQAARDGKIETEKKYGAGGNKKGSDANMAKLDAETEDFHHKKVSTSMAQDIQKARLSKKMTQAQLAQRINEKPQIINDYEAGRAIPNQQIIGKIERALGVKLRGKKK